MMERSQMEKPMSSEWDKLTPREYLALRIMPIMLERIIKTWTYESAPTLEIRCHYAREEAYKYADSLLENEKTNPI